MNKTANNSKVVTPIMRLRLKMLTPQAFDNAISEGFLEQTPSGQLISHFGTRAELAYFLGQLFCGDYQTKHVWCRGEGRFPDTQLRPLFGFSVRTSRENRIGTTIPPNYIYIDNLF